MKNVFDIVLIIGLSLSMLFCMVLFGEDVFIRQQSIHIRNKVNEIIEINSGYTEKAKIEINDLLSTIKYDSEITVSKIGKLEYGKKIDYKIVLKHNRKLPFSNEEKEIEYSITGEYYNSNY